MARKPDTPCAGCGELLYGGRGALPPGQRKCRRCRERDRLHRLEQRQPRRMRNPARTCEVCGKKYRPTHTGQRTCGRVCGKVISARPPKPKPRKLIKTFGGLDLCGDYSQTRNSAERPFVPILVCRCGGVLLQDVTKDKSLSRRQACQPCADNAERERRRQAKRRRDAKLRGVYSEAYRTADIYERDGWVCQICGEPVDRGDTFGNWAPSIDHIVALANGGPDAPANVQTAHRWCNSLKSDGELDLRAAS